MYDFITRLLFAFIFWRGAALRRTIGSLPGGDDSTSDANATNTSGMQDAEVALDCSQVFNTSIGALRDRAGFKFAGLIPYIGASLDHKSLADYPDYATVHSYHYNLMTMDGGECQWGNFKKNSTGCVSGVNYAAENDIAFRFHSLVYPLHGYPDDWEVPADVKPAKCHGCGGGGGTRFQLGNDQVSAGALTQSGKDLNGIYPEQIWSSYLAGTLSIENKRSVLVTHIRFVVSQFKGKVHSYDVVNEAVCDFGTFRYTKEDKDGNTIPLGTWHPQTKEEQDDACFLSPEYGVWLKRSLWADGTPETDLGEFIELAFTTAHETDPDALLCYNDWNWESNWEPFQKKSDEVVKLLGVLLDRGIPVQCAGFQTHIDLTYIRYVKTGWLDGYKTNMERVSDMGLKVMITEFEAKCSNMHADVQCLWNDDKSEIQAELYRDVLHICLQNPGCISFETYGWMDAVSFANSPTVRRHPYPFDECMQPKSAYFAMMEEFDAAEER